MKLGFDLRISNIKLILSCPAESGVQRRLAGVYAQYAPKLSHGGWAVPCASCAHRCDLARR
jgi:hypothetical protein